jgi:hypothetical protein
MIEHLVFNCQSSRAGVKDAWGFVPEDRSDELSQILNRDLRLPEDALQSFRRN